jgi:hypothetical protein
MDLIITATPKDSKLEPKYWNIFAIYAFWMKLTSATTPLSTKQN